MKIAALLFGTVAALLGSLWLLQGLGIVQLAPILCFADCAPVEGPSTKWAVIGAATLCAGIAAVVWFFKRRLK
jgi:hypothetical protein